MFHRLEIPILALACAAVAIGQKASTSPQIAGIRVGPHVTVSGPGPNFPSAVGYCDMDVLADEHTTVFAPGTLPGQTDYLFFVTAAPSLNTVSDASSGFRSQSSGIVVLSSSGPVNGQWALTFASDYGKYSNAPDGSSTAGNTNLCQTHGEVFRTPILHNVCPAFTNGIGNATFDLTYVGAGSVLIDPTNLGPRELLAIYNGNNNCIGHDGNPASKADEMSGYYATTGVATSDNYGKLWPAYKANYQLYAGETPSAPNAPEGASGANVCASGLDKTCSAANYPAGVYFGRYPALTPSLTVEEAVAAGARLQHTIGSQEPSAFVDDVHASTTSNIDTYVYTVQGSSCASMYCPASEGGDQGTISVARAKLNGGTGPLVFTRWYGPSPTYDSYVGGSTGASFDLQTAYAGIGLTNPFTNAGTGYDGGSPVHGGLDSPIFPMDNARSAASFRTCQAGGTGGDNDQRQGMGSISYVPATQQYLLTFVCTSPSDPSQPMPSQFDATQQGAAIFYSTLDADLYDLSRQDKWSPPKEAAGSWEPFMPDRRICSSDHKLCQTDSDCAAITGPKGAPVQNTCGLPSASDCLTPAIQKASQNPNDSSDAGCALDRYTGWYPSFVSAQSNADAAHPVNPGYLSTSADGYVFSMEGCLGPDCQEFPRVYNSRQFWIDLGSAIPTISEVVNGASFQPGIAAGSWVTIKGSNLANIADPGRIWTSSEIVNGQLPTALDGVSVTIDGKPAYVYYISQGQINVQAPSDTYQGPVSVVVTNNGQTSGPAAVELQVFSPAFFQYGTSKYAVATRNGDNALIADPRTVPGTIGANPGDVLILWGTGFGPTNPAVAAGTVVTGAPAVTTAPTILIDSVPVTVISTVLSPGSAGLYQVAIKLPSSIEAGDHTLTASVGGVQSASGVGVFVAK